MTRSTISKRRCRRLRGKLRAACKRRYSLAELLNGAEFMQPLNDEVTREWLNAPRVGREII